MFAFIRRHQVIGFVFIGLVILSFLVWFSPYSSMSDGGGGGGDGNFGSVDGKTVTREEYGNGLREAQLAYFFRFQEWPTESEATRQRFDSDRETLNRILLTRRIKGLGIEVSDKAVAERIAEIFRDRRTGAFDIRNYEGFLQTQLAAHQIGREDFERFLKHELAIMHLASVAGLTGQMITPHEAEMMYRSENEQFSAQIALFSASNYLAQVEIDPVAVGQFYTNREAFYRVPDRIQVNYVRFAVTNFFAEADQQIAKITNFNQQAEQAYLQQGAEAFKDETGKVLTPEAAKLKIKDDFRRGSALRFARRQANDFLTELFALQPAALDSLDKLAAARGLEVGTSEPFTEFGLPRGLRVPPAFSRIAFKLTPEQPFADTPIVGEDGVYVIGLKQKLPSSVPPLESIQERVAEDYKMNQARDLARQAGSAFATLVTNQLAAGKTFEAVSAEANVVPLKPPPFSARNPLIPGLERVASPAEVAMAASSLKPATASGFNATREGGFVVHLQARVPVDSAKVAADLPQFMEEMRQDRQFQAFNEWFRKQFEVANITSGMKPQTQTETPTAMP